MNRNNYFLGIFLVSLATLLLELSLTRTMSVSLWYHFGFLVISTALLGFGTSGVVLASWKKLREEYDLSKTLTRLAFLFGPVTVLSFWLLQKIPFNPFSVATDKRQLYIMPLYYITISAPFFVSGLIISLLFTRMSAKMNRLYAFDLLGAAVGCLLIVWAMPNLGGSGSVIAAAALGTTAALAFSTSRLYKVASLSLAIALAIFSFFATRYVPIAITVNKRPATMKLMPIYTRWNTFSYIEVFERDSSRRIVIDGGTAATGIEDMHMGVQQYLQQHPMDSSYESTVAYLHLPHPSILNIGSGAGQETLDALHHGARKVTCVEINPIINNIVKNKMNDYWGGLFREPSVDLVTEEGRSFINRSREQFDVIVSSHTISNAAVASGALSLSENYVLTKEAFEQYFNHLSADGTIYFTRPESQLPRLFTTAREVLAENGITDFDKHFYAFRTPPGKAEGKTSFVGFFVMKKSAFTPGEVAAMDAMVSKKHDEVQPGVWRPYGPLYSPFNQTGNIYTEILTTRDLTSLYRSHPFEIAPATDDKPFFNQHVRWSSIGWNSFKDVFSQNSPIAARMALENKPIAEVTLLLVLMQSVVLAGILILLPLFRYSRQGLQFKSRWNYLSYFACLGLGFIMIEISFIQRFTLYLGQPVYTLAVIIAGLLLFTGIGSLLCGKWNIDARQLSRTYMPILLVVLIATSLLTPVLFHSTIQWPLAARMIMTLLLLCPLGVLLGFPFPTGIKAVSSESSSFIPWAWGVNGFFTVIGSVGAVILGMMFGFKVVILLAAVCYLAGMLLLPKNRVEQKSSVTPSEGVVKTIEVETGSALKE
jgi:spermidine synthase